MPDEHHPFAIMPAAPDFSRNIARFTGFADCYDDHRPSPPDALAPLVARIARLTAPGRVVDLGSGTGLSTRYWSRHAAEVTGVEPSPDMRREAVARTSAGNVRYVEGLSHATGLPDASTDIVACSQSLHWMDPRPTFAEAARILRPGGVFVSVDYDWPPATPSWEADAAYADSMRIVRELEQTSPAVQGVRQWSKDGHLSRMRESGRFRHVREILMHHTDTGNAARLVGVMLTQGGVQTLLRAGHDESSLGLARLRETAARTLGDAPAPWHWSTRLRLAVV